MFKGLVRFTRRWILIGVILFYTVGTAMIASHTKRIFKPASAGGSEHRQYSATPETPNRPIPVVTEYRRNNPSAMINWNARNSGLIFHNIDLGNGLLNRDVNTSDPFDLQNNSENVGNENEGDEKEQKEEKPAQQELTKIQVERKTVERILRKADIEPYYRDGRIQGLQITGLDQKTEEDTVFLKNGDVILSVNGQTLNSKKEAYDIFIDARKEPVMIIDLLQKGLTNKYLLDFQ